MNIFYFFVLATWIQIFNSKTYKCVFDQLYKDYNPHLHKHQKPNQPLTMHVHGRQLAVLSRTPIRITTDTSDFDTIKNGSNGAAKTTTSHLQFIKRAVDIAKSYYQQRVQVTQAGRIYAPANCFDFLVPDNDKTNGIASSDLHVYIRYVTDKSITYGATGVHCRVWTQTTVPDTTFQAGRPTIGRIIFNTYTLLQNLGITNDQALLTNRKFATIAATALHELTHVMGFNSLLFSTYLDWRTASGVKYVSTVTAAAKLNANRPNSQLLTTPAVTTWAQGFFGCPGITGMQLQNQDGNSPGSHWQRVVMYDQLMTGTQLGAQKGISGATLALLKDTGWYVVDDRFSQTTNYGYNKGCTFYTDVCYPATNYPKYFCNAGTMSTITDCQSNFLGKSLCKNMSTLMADGCSMWADFHHCVDPNQNDDGYKQFTLQVYSTTSFCVTSTFGTSPVSQTNRARCYPYICTTTAGSQSIQFTIGSYTIFCGINDAGLNKTIGALNGYLQCPNYYDYCVNSRKICKNWCSQNGICTRGICNCYPGFSGQDCSKTICSLTQYYDPASNTCAPTCPVKTYQNKYSKTCLPCASQCQNCLNQPHLCTSCQSTIQNPQVYYLNLTTNLGVCFSKCPAGTYQLGDSCFDCDSATSKCSTCNGSATNCTSCISPYLMSGPNNGTCGTSCPDSSNRLQDRVNRKCVSTCTDNLILSQDTVPAVPIGICVLCPDTYYKWTDGTCNLDCQQGYYNDSVQRFCKQCDTSCMYCDGSYAQNCTKCKTQNSTLKYLLLKMCLSSCPTGYYANQTSGACQVCTGSLNCASCYLNATDSKVYCSTCRYGYYIQSNKTCLQGCDQYKYKNQWNHSCNDCSLNCGDCTSPYDSSCLNCRGLKVFLSNQTGGYCLDDCPVLYYVKQNGVCFPCHKTCKSCNGVSSSSCFSCADGLYLSGGYCRYVCPQKTFPNKTTLSCQDCNTNCRFCFGSTVDNCTSCESNLVLNNYTCASGCPKGMIVNQWSVCEKFQMNLKQLSYALLIVIMIWFY